ncbi:MAG: hypothetical protein JWP47_3289 [Polaromonas sp.]|jgi:hypothetical protein|nr:hypothetical protein [Polaromonas sp.]
MMRQAAAHAALAHGQLGWSGGIKRHQRIDAEHQVDALVHGDAGVHGFFKRTVHKILAINIDRRKKPRQGRAGLHGFGDGYMLPAWPTERYGVAAVQMGGNQRQAGGELTKIVGTARF